MFGGLPLAKNDMLTKKDVAGLLAHHGIEVDESGKRTKSEPGVAATPDATKTPRSTVRKSPRKPVDASSTVEDDRKLPGSTRKRRGSGSVASPAAKRVATASPVAKSGSSGKKAGNSAAKGASATVVSPRAARVRRRTGEEGKSEGSEDPSLVMRKRREPGKELQKLEREAAAKAHGLYRGSGGSDSEKK